MRDDTRAGRRARPVGTWHRAAVTAAALATLLATPSVAVAVAAGPDDSPGTVKTSQPLALLANASDRLLLARVSVAGQGTARIESYDGQGRLVDVRFSPARTLPVFVPAGGFTFVHR